MKFTTGEIISAGLGKLCCEMDRVYAVLNYLTGDTLFTHQLPRAYEACHEWVKQECPWLLELNDSACTRETWKDFLADAEARFGKEHELRPLPKDGWRPMNPVEELDGMVGKERMIVVQM